MVQDWASREQQFRSYELLSRYVMPRYKGALAGVDAAYRHAVEHRLETQQATQKAIERAFAARDGASV
jgi:hypothetical protein